MEEPLTIRFTREDFPTPTKRSISKNDSSYFQPKQRHEMIKAVITKPS